MKAKPPAQFVKCHKCGGTYGTLRKKEVIYEHVRAQDCQAHKEALKNKAKILAMAKPIEKEEQICVKL